MTNSTYDIRVESQNSLHALELGNYAFSNSPAKLSDEDLERHLNRRSEDTSLFSYLDDVAVAKVGVIPMTMNVRGKVMPMGGIGGVCSMPSARRGGHVRALMNRSIEMMHADGQAVSALFPFKTSYYEMFGYAGWQVPMWSRIKPAALAPYLNVPKTGVLKHRLTKDSWDDYRQFERTVQQHLHGMAVMPPLRMESRRDNSPSWFASVHEGDEITGGMCFTMKLHEKEAMEVYFAYWLTENARVHMLDFMARHVDQVKQIRLPLMPGEQPHLWATDDDAITISSTEDHAWNAPMARVVSVAGLTGIGAGDGEATLTILDDQAAWNRGTWNFRGENGQLTVSEGGESQGEITIAGLSALVFSGMDPVMLGYRGWGEIPIDTHDSVRSIFPPVMPHLHELF